MTRLVVCYIVIVLVAVGGLGWFQYEQDQKIRAAAIAACDRNNTVREVLRDFLSSAIKAREAAALDYTERGYTELAASSAEAAKQYRVERKKLPAVNCAYIIDNPKEIE